MISDFITALTGSPDTVMNFRVIHDTDKSLQGRNVVGTLAQVQVELSSYNQQGWGVFATVNAMDGQGFTLDHVHHIRAHVVDLDNPLTSNTMLTQALTSAHPPHFVVNTSPNKYHLHWLVEPYSGNEYYSTIQKKLAQLYDGDKSIIDPTRVLRVPGFNHNKGEPYRVTMHVIHTNPRYHPTVLAESLAHINVIDHSISRNPLGTKELAAPSLEWLKYALTMLDPNEMTRDEWMSFSAGIKQAGWTLTDEETLYKIWSDWCAQYSGNNEGENRKLWNSFRDTQIGWKSIEIRTGLTPYLKFGFNDPAEVFKSQQMIPQDRGVDDPDRMVNWQPSYLPRHEDFPELLSEEQCKEWFKGCVFIISTGEIFSPTGRFMNATKFNGAYGGKQFIISGQNSKISNEPWQAATRSTLWTIPKVDHTRFLPDQPAFSISEDGIGRKGLNIYIPIVCDARSGDVTLWLNHVAKILPDPNDQKIILDYMAHCIKFPGFKIPWAPMIQSVEGVGKTAFFEIFQHCLGEMYVYSPKASELVDSGARFNAWMKARLAIVVNEIKTDDKRELIEVLKPLITERRVEIQAKGVDQTMDDNVANWFFFSNYKDAIPISKNGRRFAVFYSALQNKTALFRAGMDKAYFDRFWHWLRHEGGHQAVNHWFLNYPIEKGQIWNVAPETSSHQEALKISRSPLEIVLDKCIAENLYGFKNGYVSSAMFHKYAKDEGVGRFTEQTMDTVLESRGYYDLGNVPEPIFNENGERVFKVYGIDFNMDAAGYKDSQIR